MNDLQIVLLLAGDGTRCWPVEQKILLSFLGKTLLEHSLDQFIESGASSFVLIVNASNKPLIEQVLKKYPGIQASVIEQTSGEGMAAALLSARQVLSKRIIIAAPHDVVDDKAIQLLIQSAKSDTQASMIVKQVDSYFPGGYVVIENGRIVRIIEKPDPEHVPGNMVALVYYYFADIQQLCRTIDSIQSEHDDQFEQAVSSLISSGLQLKPLIYNGFWGSVKYPWQVLPICQYFLNKVPNHRGERVQIDNNVIINGNVWLGDDVKIFSGAVIQGPAYIGNQTVIGNNTLVRNSHIGSSCVIGYASEVARSYVGNHCWFHTNYVGDSVIGENVAMGSGTATGNYRLDEGEISSMVTGKKIPTGAKKLGVITGDHVRIGINTSIMPGIKIGRNCIVGPGLVLSRDVPENSKIMRKDTSIEETINSRDITKLIRPNH